MNKTYYMLSITQSIISLKEEKNTFLDRWIRMTYL